MCTEVKKIISGIEEMRLLTWSWWIERMEKCKKTMGSNTRVPLA